MISKEELEYIDSGIRKLIVLLNEKGFETSGSCSGHKINRLDIWLDKYQQEVVLDYSKQFKHSLKSCFSYWKLYIKGYIMFEKKKDCLAVYNILKKSKHKNRFMLSDFLNKQILFNPKGLTQREINRVWKEIANSF